MCCDSIQHQAWAYRNVEHVNCCKVLSDQLLNNLCRYSQLELFTSHLVMLDLRY